MKNKPKGNVSRISECKYEASEKFGEIDKGKLTDCYITSFDEKGNEKKVIGITPSNSNKVDTTEVIHNYNKKSERISTINVKTGLPMFNYIYDNEGHRIESNYYNGKNLISKSKFRFENGELIEEKEYNSDGNLVTTTKYKLNGNGNVIETEEFKGEEKSALKDIYTYNDKGLNDKITSSEGEKSVSVYSIKYVSYDKNNNWTVAYHIFDGKPMYISERKIEYR